MVVTLRHMVLGLIVVLCGGLPALAQEKAADVTGTWKGTMETQMGAVENSITITSGAPLAGTVKVGEYDAKIEKGRLEGSQISFEITISPGTVAYAGTVSGDEMKLTVTGTTGNKMALVAKRQK